MSVMPAGERCARFLRVSTDKQEAQLELADVDRHIGQRGYQVARTFELAVSASSGKHEPALDAVLADIRAHRYSVVVIAHSSRIDRRDEDKQEAFALAVRMAGGRIESAREPEFGKRSIGGRVVTMLAQYSNAEYSRTLKGHLNAPVREMAAAGAFCGSVPWGFTAAGARRSKQLVPGLAATWGAPVLQRVAAGESLGDVARWLTELSVPCGRGGREQAGKWYARSVGQVVRCTALTGRTTCTYTVTDPLTQEKETLRWVHHSEPVVDPALFLAANEALDARRDNWQATGGRKPTDVLSGAVRCYACGGPLYRLTSYYRCSGTGPDRKGCGVPQVPVAVAERLTDAAWAACILNIVEEKWLPGNGAALQLKRIELEQRERIIGQSSMSRAERRAAMSALDAEFDLLENTPVTPDERKAVMTGKTWAGEWAAADTAGRRALMRNRVLYLFMGLADGTEDIMLENVTRPGRNQRYEGRAKVTAWGCWAVYGQDVDD